MREEIIKIIAEILKKDVSEIEAGLDDVNTWDSLNRVEIMFAVEDEYGITFEEEDLRLLKEDLKIRESDNPTEYDKINRTMAFMLKGIVITTMTDCQREIYELFEDND